MGVGVREGKGHNGQLTSSKGQGRTGISHHKKGPPSFFVTCTLGIIITCICVCLIKRDSLCKLKINHASGSKHAFILGTPVHMVANNNAYCIEPRLRNNKITKESEGIKIILAITNM